MMSRAWLWVAPTIGSPSISTNSSPTRSIPHLSATESGAMEDIVTYGDLVSEPPSISTPRGLSFEVFSWRGGGGGGGRKRKELSLREREGKAILNKRLNEIIF